MAKNEEQPLYRVTAKSFIGNSIVEDGAEVVYLGEPGSNLEPLNDAARKAKTEREVKFKAKVRTPRAPKAVETDETDESDLG